MTVRELINLLYEFDPDAIILVSCDQDGVKIVECADVTENIDHNVIIWP